MNLKKETIISVDCGTQSLRLIFFSKEGEMLLKEQIYYEPYVSPQPGWAEQDTTVWWEAMKKAIASAKEKAPDLLASACGLGITSQRDTVILIDNEGKLLRPAITWLDTRQAKGFYHPKGLMKFIYKVIGMYNKLVHSQKAGRCNWLQEQEKEVWDKAWKVLMVSGYFNYRLTGNPADSPASIVGHLPFNHKKRNWASKSYITAKIFPIEEEKRCKVVESGELIGNITKEAALETGLPEGLPVIACGSDKSCETLGMGCINTDSASLSFGTTATVEVCSDHYFQPLPFLPAYSAACPSCWVPEIEIFRGYWMVSWFKNELGHEERSKAASKGERLEKMLDNLLDSTPPGCYGLMLQPYWGASLKDDYAKGSMIGFGDVHGRQEMYRAIIEGLAYSLREGLEQLEKRGKFKVKKIAVSGGASQSDRVCQITADIINRPLIRGKIIETSALGAAIITAKGVGLYSSFEECIQKMVCCETVFEPNPNHRKLYDGLYRIYKKIYPALKDIFREIREVTGYPS